MSSESSQEKLAGNQMQQSADLQSRLSLFTQPMLRQAFGLAGADLGNGYDIPQSVNKAFDTAKTGMNASYQQQEMINQQMIGYNQKRMGQPISQGQMQSTRGQATYGLEQDRQTGLRNLEFQRAQAGMGQYNTLLGQMGMGINTSLNLATGNMAAATAANSMASSGSPLYGALGGAASGAATGATVGGWPGAVIGGVAGGALGYFGAG